MPDRPAAICLARPLARGRRNCLRCRKIFTLGGCRCFDPRRSRLLAFAAVGALALAACRSGASPVQRADQDRLRHGADRPACRQRQAGAARHEDLGRGNQRQGRSARASGQARLLRRSEQSFDGAGHLHQAARRRQGRPRAGRLRHQHGRAGHSGRHAEEEDLRSACSRSMRTREFHYPTSTSRCCRPARPRRSPSPKASSRSRWRKIRSRRPSRSRPRTPSSRATPARARARTPRSTASRSSTTRPIRRTRPTTRRSCARCRRPTPTS